LDRKPSVGLARTEDFAGRCGDRNAEAVGWDFCQFGNVVSNATRSAPRFDLAMNPFEDRLVVLSHGGWVGTSIGGLAMILQRACAAGVETKKPALQRTPDKAGRLSVKQ